MDYNINDFTNAIKDVLYENFPLMRGLYNGQTDEEKHPKAPLHVRDVALKNNFVNMINENMVCFEIGNNYSENNYPYYHILENAPVIRKRGESTKESRGSQNYVRNRADRDYEIVNFNGKTFSKEYRKNVRGKRREIIDKSTRFIVGHEKINEEARTYENIYYRFIERTLDATIAFVAENFGLRVQRVYSNGLKDEYVNDNYNLPKGLGYNDVMDLVNTFIGM